MKDLTKLAKLFRQLEEETKDTEGFVSVSITGTSLDCMNCIHIDFLDEKPDHINKIESPDCNLHFHNFKKIEGVNFMWISYPNEAK